ncbi:MAG: NfeD family protein [Planctomycetota bacterium]
MEWLYLFLLLIGLFYALIVGVTGGVFGGDHGVGMDVDHDISGHVDTAAGADHGTVHFSPFSPVILSMFVGSFGAAGLIAQRFVSPSLPVHLAIATGSGIFIAALTMIVFGKLFSVTQSSSHSRPGDLVNLEAEVLTPIPENGLGKIAYAIRGTRLTASARSESGKAIPANASVKVKKIAGDIFFVELVS